MAKNRSHKKQAHSSRGLKGTNKSASRMSRAHSATASDEHGQTVSHKGYTQRSHLGRTSRSAHEEE